MGNGVVQFLGENFDFIDMLPAAAVITEESGKITQSNKAFGIFYGGGEGVKDSGLNITEWLANTKTRPDTVVQLKTKDGVEKKALVQKSIFSCNDKVYCLYVFVNMDTIQYKGNPVSFGDEDDDRLDPMTGIYNHLAGAKFLAEYFHSDVVSTICYVDINGVKRVNDSLGVPAADEYIKNVVEVIRGAIRKTDIFSRMGGDEFLLIFPKCHAAIVETIMETILKKLEVINSTSDNAYEASISFGITELNPEEIKSTDAALDVAIEKMKEMKRDFYNK